MTENHVYTADIASAQFQCLITVAYI